MSCYVWNDYWKAQWQRFAKAKQNNEVSFEVEVNVWNRDPGDEDGAW